MKENSVSLRTRLLFVDEDENSRHHFCENLRDDNLMIQTVQNGGDALERLKNFPADIVMLSINGDGPTLPEEIRTCVPGAFTVAVVDSDAPEETVKAMKLGGL